MKNAQKDLGGSQDDGLKNYFSAKKKKGKETGLALTEGGGETRTRSSLELS